MGHFAKKAGRLGDEAAIVGASKYMSTKFMIEPTISVEKTKSNSFNPKFGRVAMSPRRQAVTPTNSSISTLNGNCGSAETLDLHPLKKIPNIPADDLSSNLSSPPPPPPPPSLPPPIPPPPRDRVRVRVRLRGDGVMDEMGDLNDWMNLGVEWWVSLLGFESGE